jgi:hypothetical protein
VGSGGRPSDSVLGRVFIAFADEEAELYGDICDAAARVLYEIPDDDAFIHTGDVPRKIAARVLSMLREKSGDRDERSTLERLRSHPSVVSGDITAEEMYDRLLAYDRRTESLDAYEDIGPIDDDVVAVAWGDLENLVPVIPRTFRTFFINDKTPHGVEFVRRDTGEYIEGNADNLFGLVWLEGLTLERAFLGATPPSWASGT